VRLIIHRLEDHENERQDGSSEKDFELGVSNRMQLKTDTYLESCIHMGGSLPYDR
jgi:hypothetical protein